MEIIFKNYFVVSVTTTLDLNLPAPQRQGQIIRPILNALKQWESSRNLGLWEKELEKDGKLCQDTDHMAIWTENLLKFMNI